VISSDISSIPEIVAHDRNGWLLPVTDRPGDEIADDIAARLRVLMDDKATYQRMCGESLAVVREKFDLRVRNKRLTDIYDAALAGR
jgi:glycosyltransferase involved in cell wall biosynthesis